MNNKAIFLLLLFYFTTVAFSQTEREVKLSGKYHWGEAIGKSDDIEALKRSAKEDLLFKISSVVTLSNQLDLDENQKHATDEFHQTTRTVTKLHLLNLKYLGPIKVGSKIRIVAYISNEDYQRSLNNLKTEIKDMIKIAETTEKKEGLGAAVTEYYKAYLKCAFSPDPIEYQSVLHKTNLGDVRPFLRAKIKEYLSKISLRPLAPSMDAAGKGTVHIPINAQAGAKPATGCAISVLGQEQQFFRIINGRAIMSKEELPMQRKEVIPVSLCLYLGDNGDFPELCDLAESERICVENKITVDYTPVIKLDFTVQPQGEGTYLFTPVVKNIKLTSVRWEFGDGNASEEMNPTYSYKQHGIYDVTLTLNQQNDLQVSRAVAFQTQLATETSAPERESGLDQVTEQERETLDRLLTRTSFNELMKELKLHKYKGALVYGKKKAFPHPEECYVFIVNPQNKAVVAVLTPGLNKRSDLISHQVIKDIGSRYKTMVAIWVKLYD